VVHVPDEGEGEEGEGTDIIITTPGESTGQGGYEENNEERSYLDRVTFMMYILLSILVSGGTCFYFLKYGCSSPLPWADDLTPSFSLRNYRNAFASLFDFSSSSSSSQFSSMNIATTSSSSSSHPSSSYSSSLSYSPVSSSRRLSSDHDDDEEVLLPQRGQRDLQPPSQLYHQQQQQQERKAKGGRGEGIQGLELRSLTPKYGNGRGGSGGGYTVREGTMTMDRWGPRSVRL
jgi:hypothetical protein